MFAFVEVPLPGVFDFLVSRVMASEWRGGLLVPATLVWAPSVLKQLLRFTSCIGWDVYA